jgi:intermediate peptidase
LWATLGNGSSLNLLRGLQRSTRSDDEAIRTAFDQPATSHGFFAASSSRALEPTGLFLHPLLTTPEALASITQQTLIHAHHLVDRISSIAPSFTPSFPNSPFASQPPLSPYEQARRSRQVPKLLDRLSDTICLVIDMCELIRNVHPDDRWVSQADSTYEILGNFMNGLNTHTGLYEVSSLYIAFEFQD